MIKNQNQNQTQRKTRRCEICKKDITAQNLYTHNKTAKHINNLKLTTYKTGLLDFNEKESNNNNIKKSLEEIKELIINLISNL